MLTQPDRYDIALLKLDHPVLYRDNIIPICLPSLDHSLVGKVGVVAGWGKTDNSFGKMDACLGDSGGPLVINFDGRWTLIGITSAGFGCAVEKQPGIYHKVSKTAKWLSQQINKDSPKK